MRSIVIMGDYEVEVEEHEDSSGVVTVVNSEDGIRVGHICIPKSTELGGEE